MIQTYTESDCKQFLRKKPQTRRKVRLAVRPDFRIQVWTKRAYERWLLNERRLFPRLRTDEVSDADVIRTIIECPPHFAFGTFVQKTGADVAATNSTTLTLNGVVAGNTIISEIRVGSTTSFSLADGQGSYANDVAIHDVTNTDFLYLFSLPNTNAGTHVVTCTVVGTAATVRWSLCEYTGNCAIDKISTGQGSATIADSGLTATTTFTTELLIGAAKSENNMVTPADSGSTVAMTIRDSETKVAISDAVVATTGAYKARITTGTSDPTNAWGLIATYSQRAGKVFQRRQVSRLAAYRM